MAESKKSKTEKLKEEKKVIEITFGAPKALLANACINRCKSPGEYITPESERRRHERKNT